MNAKKVKLPFFEIGPKSYLYGDDILELAGAAGTALGTGGMVTKLSAAKLCIDAGTDMIIANGSNPSVLYDIFDGKAVGTRFIGKDK